MGKINLSNIQASLNRAKETAAPLQNKGHTENVPVDLIHLAERNIYNENDTDEAIKELADNIEACGLLHPIAVHKISSYNYQIISGERRYRAITEYLHWKSIPCMVFEGLSKDSAQLKLYMANLAVREYTSGQRFKYYMEVKELLGRMAKSGEYSGGLQKGIAEILNVTERQVKKYAQLEKMPQEIQQAVIEGKLSINKALEMAAKSQEQVKVKKQTEEIIGNIIERLSDAQKKKLLDGEIDFSRLFDNDNLLSKGEPVPLDVAVTSPKIKTSEKREPVPLDIATTSLESETSEKREPVPLDIVATSPEIETSEKGEPVPLDIAEMSPESEISKKGKPVPLDIATTSPKIKTSEKGEPVPLDVAVTSPKIETSEKREPVPLDVVVTSPKIETSEKGEPVPLDVVVTSPKIETSEKREPVPPNIDKSYYMSRVVKVLDISVKKIDNGKIAITLPYLMPKRTSIDSDAYIIDPLSYALRMYVEQNKHEKFRHASVAIIFIHTPEDRRIIRDLDNIETHHVINIISTMLLVDDNLIDMGLFNRPGDYVHTEIIVSSKDKKNEEDEKKDKNA